MPDTPAGLTPEQLAEIRTRCEAAARPPWHAELFPSLAAALADGNFRWIGQSTYDPYMGGPVGCVFRGDEDGCTGMPGCVETDAATAVFISRARQDIPALLAEVARLRTALGLPPPPPADTLPQ